MVADSPSYGALLASSRSLVGLTLNTEVHDVISANGTVVDYNVPRPKRDGIPLLDFEALFLALYVSVTALGDLLLLDGSVGHIDIGHFALACCTAAERLR